MIILENPYVSDFLIETIKRNKFSVLNNEIARKYLNENELLAGEFAINTAKEELIYTNSENSIDWIDENLSDENINQMIKICKDKAVFRNTLKSIFPNYYFEELTLEEVKKLDSKKLNYPLVLKPTVGFLSFGVYPIKNEEEFCDVLLKIDSDIEKFKGVFPNSVVDTSKFMLEKMIEGDEYALDAYYDENGKAVILNIFQHPFLDENDVSDRVYFSSKGIIEKYLSKFENLLNKIGEVANFKNFPFHLELRVKQDEIIPIEINPMRFCGWCITDIAYYSWNINVYEYFLNNKKPNWEEILKKSDEDYFYFTIADIPSSINKNEIIKINYDEYLKNISNPLDIRKIDYKTKPVFAIVFGKTSNYNEIKNLLSLDMGKFIELEKR